MRATSTLADPTRRAIFERLCRDGEQRQSRGGRHGRMMEICKEFLRFFN